MKTLAICLALCASAIAQTSQMPDEFEQYKVPATPIKVKSEITQLRERVRELTAQTDALNAQIDTLRELVKQVAGQLLNTQFRSVKFGDGTTADTEDVLIERYNRMASDWAMCTYSPKLPRASFTDTVCKHNGATSDCIGTTIY